MLKKYGQQLILIGLGFIIGAMVTDALWLDTEIKSRQSAYDYGILLMSEMEKPKRCPYCGGEYYYSFNLEESELQRMINTYLGE